MQPDPALIPPVACFISRFFTFFTSSHLHQIFTFPPFFFFLSFFLLLLLLLLLALLSHAFWGQVFLKEPSNSTRYAEVDGSNQSALHEFLGGSLQSALSPYFGPRSGIESRQVPYKHNTLVMFKSSLLHQTTAVRFRRGYENRRINYTLLFGQMHDKCAKSDSAGASDRASD